MTSSPRVDARTAILLVRCDGKHYGLPLSAVERVLPMAAVVPLPDAADTLLGVLNLHGTVLPVVDPHARLGLPRPRLAADHRLVLLKATNSFLLWVDEVDDVLAPGPEAFSSVPSTPGTSLVAQIVRIGDNIVPLLAPGALEPSAACA